MHLSPIKRLRMAVYAVDSGEPIHLETFNALAVNEFGYAQGGANALFGGADPNFHSEGDMRGLTALGIERLQRRMDG